MIDIRQAMTDPQLFGAQFGGDSFAAWRALLAGFYGLPLEGADLDTFKALTGRENAPSESHRELWLPIGRRGGKSQVAALLALYEALFKDHGSKLSAGEVATCMVIAADRKQARAVMRYISGLVEANPMIREMVRRENSEAIEFNNRTTVEVHTASHRAVRGYTLAAAILDECAFWHVDGANPDKEILTALRPALVTLQGKLVALSSPYAKRGILWDAYKRYFAKENGRVLVAQAPTLTMNPTIPVAEIEEAKAEDREHALAEYEAQFRSDIAMLLDVDLIEDCTRPRPLELARADGTHYHAFVDPAGGGADEFTLSIAHNEGTHTVIDLVRGRKGSPAEIVAEYAHILKSYGLSTVTGDRYAGRWPRDEFRRHDITYIVSELDRSALYLELLAAFNSGRVELPPCEKLKRQLASLERRTSRAGRDIIDHPPGGHDDRANAIAGAIVASKRRKPVCRTRNVAGMF